MSSPKKPSLIPNLIIPFIILTIWAHSYYQSLQSGVSLSDTWPGLIIMAIILAVILWIVYAHFRDMTEFNIIKGLIQSNSYTTTTLVDIESKEIKGKGGSTYYYTYVCKDFASGIEYKSELLKRKDLYTIGSHVPVYHDDVSHPGIYWIDFDSTIISPIVDNLRDYQLDKIETTQKKFRIDYKNGLSKGFGASITLFLFMLGFIGFLYLFSTYGKDSPLSTLSLLLWPCIILLAYGTITTCIEGFRLRNEDKIRREGKVYTGVLRHIEKTGWKSVPLGYIPPEERVVIDDTVLDTYIENKNTPVNNIGDAWKNAKVELGTTGTVGYQYIISVQIGEKIIKSRKLYTPFPQKGAIGAKVNVYSMDDTLTQYVIDEESIDILTGN